METRDMTLNQFKNYAFGEIHKCLNMIRYQAIDTNTALAIKKTARSLFDAAWNNEFVVDPDEMVVTDLESIREQMRRFYEAASTLEEAISVMNNLYKIIFE